MGLRELKKTRTRQAVQRAAMRLFDEQGYAATTVEQIAFAAEISTATFYRYYCDKQDVVFGDDDHVLVEGVIRSRPPDEPLADTFRELFQRLADDFERNRDAVMVRMRLMNAVPELQARRWANRRTTADLLALLLAPRAGTGPDDHHLRLAINVALAAEWETLCYWARIDGAEPLACLLSDALAQIEPVFGAWSGPRSGQPALEPAVEVRKGHLQPGGQREPAGDDDIVAVVLDGVGDGLGKRVRAKRLRVTPHIRRVAPGEVGGVDDPRGHQRDPDSRWL
jgi:AcrR family transcriptional regulator